MTDEQQVSSKMGITMLIIAWGIILGLLGIFFKQLLDHQDNPNTHPASQSVQEYIEVSLLPNRQHHYVVTGEINHQAVTFLLDTGATDIAIPESVARSLGLNRGQKYYATTANGTVAVYSTLIKTLHIGDIKLKNIQASINPAMDGELVLLGMSALRQIEFSQNGNGLILRQQR